MAYIPKMYMEKTSQESQENVSIKETQLASTFQQTKNSEPVTKISLPNLISEKIN